LRDELEKESADQITIRNYKEISRFCVLLAEEAGNSIENWTDIIPEADLKTEIGVITGLADELIDKENEFEVLQEELRLSRTDSSDSKIKSSKKMDELSKEIRQLKSKIKTQSPLSSTVASVLGFENIRPSDSVYIKVGDQKQKASEKVVIDLASLKTSGTFTFPD